MRTVQLLRLLGRSALTLLFLVLVTGSTTVLAQTTYYVDTGGSNAFDGLTPATAFQTIGHAITTAAAGDIISIEAGTYSESVTVAKDNLRFESRPDGVITTVTIDGDFTNNASGTQVGVTGTGDFQIAGASRTLTLQSGTLAVDNFALPSGVTIVRSAGAVTGDITFPSGAINVTYNGTGNISTGVELPADLNEGDLLVNQTGTVTLSVQPEVDDLTVGAGATLVGTVSLAGNAGGNDHDVTGTGTAGTLIVHQVANIQNALTLTGALDVRSGGTVNLGANVTVGSVALVMGGTLNIGTNTLNVTGNFNRTGGALTFGAGGTLAFTGSSSATFAGGPNLSVANLVVNKSGDAVVTFTQDVNVTGNLTITAGTADLGARTVTVSGATSVVTVNGTLTQTEGILLFPAGSGATIQGTGTYGSLTILEDVTLGSNVRFAGTLNLLQGGVDTDGFDISPIGDAATVSRNLAAAGTAVGGTGTFNAQNVRYNLTYTGALGGGSATAGAEFNVANLRNVTVSATNGTVDASGAAGGTISGNVTIPAAADAANAVTLTWPEANVTVAGALTVGARQTIATGAAHTLTLSGNGQTHMVAGLITGNDTVRITGVGVTVNGSTETTFAAAELPAVQVDTSATLSNIQVIDGLVTVSNDASLALGMAHEMEVTGGFSVGTNADLTFNSNVNVTGGTIVGGAGATYAGSGRIILDGATAIGVAGSVIPQLQVDQAVALTDNVEVGDSLVVNATITAPATDTLTVSGGLRSAGGTLVTGGGEVIFDDATAHLGGDATIGTNVTVEEELSIVSNVANTPRTLTISGNLTLSGVLDLANNSVEVAGNIVNDGGSVAATTGAVISGAGNIVPNGTLTIPNLTIAANTQITGAAGTLAVPGRLTLNAQLSRDTDNKVLSIGDGAIITLASANPLQFAPTFVGRPSVVVNVGQTSGSELPTTGNIQDLTIASGVTYTLAQNVNVAGTLTTAGTIANAGNTLTLGAGGTLALLPGHVVPTLSATSYNLTYAAGSQTTTTGEFLPAPAEVVTLTSNVGAGETLTFHDALTVANLVQQSGSLNFGGHMQTVLGNATLNFAAITPGGATVLRFAGPGNHTLTVSGNQVVPDQLDVEIAKTANGQVTLSGGNLNLRTNLQTLILTSGALETAGDAAVVLYQDATTQGFTRGSGMVTGNVQKRLYEGDPFGTIPAGEPGATQQRAARFEFPTGAPGGEYRPMALTFLNNIEQRTDLTVRHEPVNPGGTAGLPLDGGNGVTVSGYPNFYWFVGASQSLGQAQSFNVEITGTELGVDIAGVEDLRIIRRFDPSPVNPWVLQGVAANYSNVVVGDDDALVRVTGSTGGIVTQGSRFTIGLEVRPPVISIDEDGTFVPLTDDTVVEAPAGATTNVNLQFSAQDVGQTAEIELGDAPEWVTLEDVVAEGAVLRIAPPLSEVGSEHDVTITVTDPDGEVSVTFTISVTAGVQELTVTGRPSATNRVAPGNTLEFTLTATGATGDVTFELADTTVANATLTQDDNTATFTFAPDTTQLDSTFAFSILVSDEDTTITINFSVSVEEFEPMLGDVSENGEVTAFDASLVLRHVVGDITLTESQLDVADVSGNGTVSAFDAALILQFDAEIISCFPADPECNGAGKAIVAATGELSWGEVTGDGLAKYIPISLTGNVSGVYSAEITVSINHALATVKAVESTNLPNGWQVSYRAVEGQLKIAMAGTQPLANAGEIARIAIELASESASVTATAEGNINENGVTFLGEVAAREIPTEFELGDNYPNPFNPTTTFTYSLPENGQVMIQVFDITGRRVRVLVNEEKDAGVHRVQWDGRNDAGMQVASGMYLYQIRSGSFVEAKKMMLVK